MGYEFTPPPSGDVVPPMIEQHTKLARNMGAENWAQNQAGYLEGEERNPDWGTHNVVTAVKAVLSKFDPSQISAATQTRLNSVIARIEQRKDKK